MNNFFSQSYWDWLPPEIQEYILLFAAAQNFMDIKTRVKRERDSRSIRQRLREEIMEYDTLKNAWGLGHIQCKLRSCTEKHCSRRFMPWHAINCPKTYVIIGHYRDTPESTKREIYLGRNFNHVYSRLNHVKSSLKTNFFS